MAEPGMKCLIEVLKIINKNFYSKRAKKGELVMKE
jgi:hypothetical protein